MARIAVAGPSKVVTDAAAVIGDAGGSVVDVIIVASLTAMCTEPGICGPGGGGFLTVDLPGRDPVVIDGYMAFPGKGFEGEPETREVTMAYGGGVTTLVGAGSVAVPGAFAALGRASEMFGRVPWGDLMDVVAEVAERGFPLSVPCHTYLDDGAAPIFGDDPAARGALLDDDGRPKAVGANVVFPGLAATLRHLGRHGASDFYTGELGRSIVSDLEARGGQLTMGDLTTYEAMVRTPLQTTMARWRLSLNPEPAVGGVTVARVLDGLEDPADVAGLAVALVGVFEARRRGALRSPSTISVAAADDTGGAVAASFSAGYGSGVIPAGTGLLMNNALGELELADRPPVVGERMISNMAPTVGRRGHEVVAVGSPGADRITTAVATTLARIGVGESLRTAIDHPRAHPEFGDFGVRLAVEPGLEISGVGLALRSFEARHMYFGGVNGAGLMDGEVVAYADSRRTGSVAFTG